MYVHWSVTYGLILVVFKNKANKSVYYDLYERTLVKYYLV